MRFIPLSHIRDETPGQIRKEFGGKGLGLWEAFQAGIRIPETWMLSADCFEAFFHEKKSSVQEFLLKRFSKELHSLPNGPFAVRSSYQLEDSTEHSFAGIFETKLDVAKENIFAAIEDVWKSCYSLRAVSYQGDPKSLRMAVILQPMITAKYAGVAFSKHPSPATVFENQNIVVEFAAAAGEQVVQGEITPFRLSGSTSELQLATDSPWITDLLTAIEELKHFHHHEVDIEFVIDQKETFFLVQQRPISRMHASHTLDLSNYQRQYKRALLSLDVELLIEGCSKYLASYLEAPFQMERWMVMVSNPEGGQELWVHKLINKAVTYSIIQKMQEDRSYLQRIEERYQDHHNQILHADYDRFFEKKTSLHSRFFAWCEFILPFLAHYYVPMFMIDALHIHLQEEMKKIDPKQAEDDLFEMGTSGISTLMDLLHEELLELKKTLSAESFQEVPASKREVLENLAKKYGFMNCHQVHEEGYTAKELFSMMLDLTPAAKPKEPKRDLFQAKYLSKKETRSFFDHFRHWMKIRNQEMEYVMHAMLKSRPLFMEIAESLKVSVKDVWDSSRESVLKGARIDHRDLTILRSYGKTRLLNGLKILKVEKDKKEALRGKTVWGEGKIEGNVLIAYKPEDLKTYSPKTQNNILVTGMTTPDFMPYLKKHFLALVTDEGGILCHAAIVARELPISCIVGTGLATEVLKNNDQIILDLDRGEISIK